MTMATILAAMPDMRSRVLIEHVPDYQGRCWTCRISAEEAAAWPCAARRIAEEAESMAQERDREAAYSWSSRAFPDH